MRKRMAFLLALLVAVGAVPACSSKTTDDGSVSLLSAPSQTEELSENSENPKTESSGETTEVSTEQSEKSSAAESETTSNAQSSAQSSENSKPESSVQSSENSKPESSTQPSENSKPESSTQQSESRKAQTSSEPIHTSEPAAPSQPSAVNEPSSASSVPSQVSKTPEVSESVKVSGTEETSKPTPVQPVVKPAVPSDPDIGGMTLYNSLFSLDSEVGLEVKVDKSEMNKLQQDYYKYKKIGSKSPIYRKATVVLTVNGQSYTIEEVGIRLKGNMSLSPVYADDGRLNLSHYKLSFNETFDDKDRYGADAKQWASDEERKARKNRRFATLKELDIKWNLSYDETYIRELYAAEMSREQGLLAQHINLAHLNFNGENYGVMKIYEPVDEIFLEKNLPESALGGDLYKCGWTFKPCNYVYNEVTYGVEDKDKGKKYNYNLKTNKKTSDNSSLKNLLKVLSQNPSKAELEKVVDTSYFAKFLAMSYFLGDPDDIRNNYNNHYVYFRKDNGKAIFIIYDNDRTLGVTYGYNPDGTGMTGQSPFSAVAAGAGGQQRNPLIKMAILNSNAYLKSEYTAALKQIAASGYWDTSVFNSYYEKARSHYKSYVTPTVSFANVKETFRFSLDGKYPSGDRANMSFSEYVTRIMKSYRSAVGE